MPDPARRLFEDLQFIVDHAEASAVPGYVIVRLTTAEMSIAELSPVQAAALGVMLGRVLRAVQASTHADRVYCLSFCEVERRLHFHLFPRTDWLLQAYWRDTGRGSEPVNGPQLFDWARTQPVGGLTPPIGSASLTEVCDALRARLRLA